MKKLLAATILGLASLTAMAGSTTVEYSSVSGLNGKPGGTGYLVNFKDSITNNIDWGMQLLSSQVTGSNSVSTRFEASLTPKYTLGFGTIYTKATLGTKLSSSAGTTEYYAIEPGINVPLTDKLSVRAGYRYRTAFDNRILDTTRTSRLGVTFDMTKTDAVTLRYDSQRGDSLQNSWNLAYTRKF